MQQRTCFNPIKFSLVFAALLPGHAHAIPVPPAGLFDVMITSNCFNFPEQSNISNPYWHVERVSVWPGQSNIHLRTVSDSDTVSFSSSHPHLVQNIPKMQLPGPIGGILYTRTSTFINFNEPDQATNIEVNVHSSHPATSSFTLNYLEQAMNSLYYLLATDAPVDLNLNPGNAWNNRGIDTRKLRLYPYLEFQGLTSSQENQNVSPGTTVNYTAKFSYAHATNGLTEVTFSRPQMQVGTDPQWYDITGSGWPVQTEVKKRQPGQKDMQQSLVANWPSNSMLSGKNLAHVKVRLRATPRQHSCVKGMASDTLEFRLQNPNYQPSARLPRATPISNTQDSTDSGSLQRAPSKIDPVTEPELMRQDPRIR